MGPYSWLVDWGGNNWEAGVGGAERTGSKLLAEHPQVHLHRQQLRFALQVGLAGHLMASNYYPHRCILDPLQFFDVSGGGVGEPDGASVGEEGLEDGFVSGEEGLFAVAPCGASEGLQHLKAASLP